MKTYAANASPEDRMAISVIDLFAGPGGLGEGFSSLRDSSGEPLEVQEPITLAERRAFLRLPVEERRRILGKQTTEVAAED